MSEPKTRVALELERVEQALSERLRKLDLVGIRNTPQLRASVDAHLDDVLQMLKSHGYIRHDWGVEAKWENDNLVVRFKMPVDFIPLKLKLSCGCHCAGGCADPYAPCAHPCAEHTPP